MTEPYRPRSQVQDYINPGWQGLPRKKAPVGIVSHDAISGVASRPLEAIPQLANGTNNRFRPIGYQYAIGPQAKGAAAGTYRMSPEGSYTNQIRDPGSPSRQGGVRPNWANSNTIGVALVGPAREHTREQVAHGLDLVQDLANQHGMPAKRGFPEVIGHGQLQPTGRNSRPSNEGLPLVMAVQARADRKPIPYIPGYAMSQPSALPPHAQGAAGGLQSVSASSADLSRGGYFSLDRDGNPADVQPISTRSQSVGAIGAAGGLSAGPSGYDFITDITGSDVPLNPISFRPSGRSPGAADLMPMDGYDPAQALPEQVAVSMIEPLRSDPPPDVRYDPEATRDGDLSPQILDAPSSPKQDILPTTPYGIATKDGTGGQVAGGTSGQGYDPQPIEQGSAKDGLDHTFDRIPVPDRNPRGAAGGIGSAMWQNTGDGLRPIFRSDFSGPDWAQIQADPARFGVNPQAKTPKFNMFNLFGGF